jgi:hypothetical protein
MALPQYDPRDDVTDAVMKQRGATPFDYGLAGLGSAAPAQSPMTGPVMPGLPQTPAGGVPGAGIGPAPPSTVALPPQRTGMMGAMPMMGGLGQAPGLARAPGLGGMVPPGQQRRRPY